MKRNAIMTVDDLSEYTGWSKSYIYKKTSDGTLKFSKPLGKTIFFSKIWIDEFLLSRMNSTKDELKTKATHYLTLKSRNND